MTTPTIAGTGRRDVSPRTLNRTAVRVARRRFLRALLVSGAWFWALWGLLVAGVPLAVERWGGDMEGLSYDAAGGPARWVAFTVGAVVTAGWLTLHLAAGGTRRSFVEGAARAAVVAGGVFGVLAVLLAVAEERLYTSLDRTWQGTASAVPLDTPAGFVVTAAGEALVVVTYTLVGLSVVGGYRRFGAWRGTLFIAPLLLPAALADVATATGMAGLLRRGGPDAGPLAADLGLPLGAAVVVVGGLAAAVIAAVVAGRVLRSVPVSPGQRGRP